MWLRAKHLHTSAERRLSPLASLSPPELLGDLFTCSPHAVQAGGKKDRKEGMSANKEEGREKNGGARQEGEGSRRWAGPHRCRVLL